MVTRKIFSILIIFHNEVRSIQKTLQQIFSQKYPAQRFEVICVNDGSIDASTQVVVQYPVRLINIKRSGISVARNTGLRYCSGKYILFLDAHLYLHSRDTLHRLEKLFKKYPHVDGICGEYWSKDCDDNNYARDIRRKILFGKAGRRRFISLHDFTTWSIAIGAYRKTIFDRVLFPEGFSNSFGEDTYLQIQLHNLGYQLLYSPDIAGIHDARINKNHLLRKMLYEIRAAGNILLKASSEKSKLTIPYLHYFLSYPFGFIISIGLLYIFSPWISLMIVAFFLLEFFPLLKIIVYNQYPIHQRVNTAFYVLIKEFIQAVYLPIYILSRTQKPQQLFYILKQIIRWEFEKLRAVSSSKMLI